MIEIVKYETFDIPKVAFLFVSVKYYFLLFCNTMQAIWVLCRFL